MQRSSTPAVVVNRRSAAAHAVERSGSADQCRGHAKPSPVLGRSAGPRPGTAPRQTTRSRIARAAGRSTVERPGRCLAETQGRTPARPARADIAANPRRAARDACHHRPTLWGMTHSVRGHVASPDPRPRDSPGQLSCRYDRHRSLQAVSAEHKCGYRTVRRRRHQVPTAPRPGPAGGQVLQGGRTAIGADRGGLEGRARGEMAPQLAARRGSSGVTPTAPTPNRSGCSRTSRPRAASSVGPATASSSCPRRRHTRSRQRAPPAAG